MDASDHADERPPRQPYVEPLVGERRACRCLKCGSCGGTFLHDAPISDFKCPGCGLVLCQSCADAGHGENGDHAGLDPAKVNRDLRARAERAEKAREDVVEECAKVLDAEVLRLKAQVSAGETERMTEALWTRALSIEKLAIAVRALAKAGGT